MIYTYEEKKQAKSSDLKKLIAGYALEILATLNYPNDHYEKDVVNHLYCLAYEMKQNCMILSDRLKDEEVENEENS